MQLVLLYVNESWVVTGSMLKVLEGFQYQVARRILGMMSWCKISRELEWPPMAEDLWTPGLCPINEYIQQRQTTVAVQVAWRPLYELFLFDIEDAWN